MSQYNDPVVKSHVVGYKLGAMTVEEIPLSIINCSQASRSVYAKRQRKVSPEFQIRK
jgi:hypothetical protein